MAQSGYTPILIYASGTATNVPLAANMTSVATGAELAINYTDGKLYYKNNSGVVTLLASSSGASGDVVGPASATDNALARFDLTTGKLIQNSVGILSDAGILTGLTGLTSSGSITLSSLTSGRVTYAGTAGLLQDSANLTFNGTTLTANTIGAYTLSGTIAGGGNQINNVIIGTSTPLAGSFTTINASTSITNAGLTSGRVTYAGTAGLLQDDADFTFNGTTVTMANDASISGLTVGKGGGAIATNTVLGYVAGNTNTTGNSNTYLGYGVSAGGAGTGSGNIGVGFNALNLNVGTSNTAVGAGINAVLASALESNTSGSYNTAIGAAALKSNQTASSSTAVGYQALYLNTTSNNTAFGDSAAYTNTSGTQNTAIGQGALYTNNGNYNVALGFQTALTNSSGSSITALGYQAMYYNTASNNTAVGYKAGYSMTSGVSNIAIGSSTMSNSLGITGSYNIGIGNSAFNVLTSGNRNIGIGPEALVATNTGVSNVAIGSYDAAGGAAVMGANTSGNYNVAVGAAALTTQSSADANTAVGYRAGGSNNNTGTNNVYFGYQAGLLNTSGSQNIFIGDRAGSESAGVTGGNNGGIGAFALSKNTTGSSNFAYGDQALRANTSGANNVAIGANALIVNISSNGNVAVGYQAGYKQTSGTGNNVFIGNQAGYNNVAGTGSTIIGTASGFTGGTQNNNTYIGQGTGYEATGTQNTYVGVPSTTQNCGGLMQGGNYNTIIGNYPGNYDSLDIRNSSRYVVLSDGEGNRQITMAEGLTLALDSAVPNTGTGITFPATQLASANANTLDDYEEGDWTPTDGSGAALSFSSAVGKYTKIGRAVFVEFRVTYPSTVSASNAVIASLPFTNNNNDRDNVPVTILSSGTAVSGMFNQGGTDFGISTIGTFTSTTNATLSTITLRGSGWYVAA